MRIPKVDFTLFPGLCLGISFPMTDYVDMNLCFLCFGLSVKWRKR